MKIRKVDNTKRGTVKMKTTDQPTNAVMAQWWTASSDTEEAQQLLSTTAFLKEAQAWRQRQIAIYARLYGNQTLFSFMGSDMSRLGQFNGLPNDRPTFNLISSVVDTLVSKLTQSRPQPVFLTDNSDYKERNLAKKLNNFILGEFYQVKAYEKAEYILRDALATGTGVIKIFETDDHKVGIERVLQTELFTDLAESQDDDPRQLYQVKLVDREVLKASFPKYKADITDAQKATPDGSPDSSKSVSDLVMVVEGWHLRSSKKSKDGRHTIAVAGSPNTLLSEQYDKDFFPFVFLQHTKRLKGFWSAGVAENLMGTQMELNSLLHTISRAIKLVGVPRVFIEDGSKVVKSHNNNEIGVMVTYRGVKPSYEVAPCVPQEMYQERDRIIQYGYRQEGLSEMAASSEKPAGLDSGEALRTYDDINTDRFAALSRRYDNFFIDLAYRIIDLAKDIAEREGSYQTVYPNKSGVKEIDLPKASLLQDTFVIRAFNESSLPKDPAGRLQRVTEMIQSGMITIQDGRRLIDYPDLEQIETLSNASQERIFQYLDKIIEDGDYNGPDSFMDLALAVKISVQYYNLYIANKLEPEKADMIRTFNSQAQAMIQSTTPPPMPSAPTPTAAPQPPPTSPMINNNAGGQTAA